ncbi:hypothetical protein SESBI_38974 [Sesbania bispinosa]|nr:hypothetical protein SESBI_38974 [Sesbania bispinosa]
MFIANIQEPNRVDINATNQVNYSQLLERLNVDNCNGLVNCHPRSNSTIKTHAVCHASTSAVQPYVGLQRFKLDEERVEIGLGLNFGEEIGHGD